MLCLSCTIWLSSTLLAWQNLKLHTREEEGEERQQQGQDGG